MKEGFTLEPSIFFHGFAVGLKAMTTLLVVNRRPIDLDSHTSRLLEHAKKLRLLSDNENERMSHRLRWVATNLIEEFQRTKPLVESNLPLRLRLYVIGQSDDPAIFPLALTVDVVGSIEAIPTLPSQVQAVKLRATVNSSHAKGEHIKTGDYGHTYPFLVEARREGFDDVLFVNSDQEITECASANIFLIGREGDQVEIATPPVASGIIKGVTRRRMMKLLLSAKINVTERMISLDEIPRFDEAFMTSSIAGLRPVDCIGRHKLRTTRSTSVYNHLERLWKTWILTQSQD